MLRDALLLGITNLDHSPEGGPPSGANRMSQKRKIDFISFPEPPPVGTVLRDQAGREWTFVLASGRKLQWVSPSPLRGQHLTCQTDFEFLTFLLGASDAPPDEIIFEAPPENGTKFVDANGWVWVATSHKPHTLRWAKKESFLVQWAAVDPNNPNDLWVTSTGSVVNTKTLLKRKTQGPPAWREAWLQVFREKGYL